MPNKHTQPKISVVVPVLNEEACLKAFWLKLRQVFDHSSYQVEYLFVNDGSRDGTLDILKQIHGNNPELKVISFSRNFGHQMALTAGLDHASGDAVITMDADLQHPPELIPELIRKWQEGFDIVYTVRTETKKEGWFKRFSSRLFYAVLKSISSTSVELNAADFRLLSRKAVDGLQRCRERDRYIRGLVSWIGYKKVAVPYVANERQAGNSKYSVTKMIRFALDGITSFSLLPLHLASYLGFVSSLASLIYAVQVIYLKVFVRTPVPGWTTIVILVLFFGGVQLLSLGIIGEYLGKTYNESKRRPLYIIDELLGL